REQPAYFEFSLVLYYPETFFLVRQEFVAANLRCIQEQALDLIETDRGLADLRFRAEAE
ncbi:hypothetical protein JYU34_014969, partial [Plutella xylostella]